MTYHSSEIPLVLVFTLFKGYLWFCRLLWVWVKEAQLFAMLHLSPWCYDNQQIELFAIWPVSSVRLNTMCSMFTFVWAFGWPLITVKKQNVYLFQPFNLRLTTSWFIVELMFSWACFLKEKKMRRIINGKPPLHLHYPLCPHNLCRAQSTNKTWIQNSNEAPTQNLLTGKWARNVF